MQNEQCNNLVIDYNVGQCRLYKGCQTRMITNKWPPVDGGLAALNLSQPHFESTYLDNHPNPDYGKEEWNNAEIDWDLYRLECPARNNYLQMFQFIKNIYAF